MGQKSRHPNLLIYTTYKAAPYIHNPEDKAKALGDSFFPAPPEPDLEDLEGYAYPDLLECPAITIEEIKAAL